MRCLKRLRLRQIVKTKTDLSMACHRIQLKGGTPPHFTQTMKDHTVKAEIAGDTCTILTTLGIILLILL